MPEHLTTDERVKLAELCGHKVHMVSLVSLGDAIRESQEFEAGLRTQSTTDGEPVSPHIIVNGAYVKWHPDVDANQRDEVVAALVARGM